MVTTELGPATVHHRSAGHNQLPSSSSNSTLHPSSSLGHLPRPRLQPISQSISLLVQPRNPTKHTTSSAPPSSHCSHTRHQPWSASVLLSISSCHRADHHTGCEPIWPRRRSSRSGRRQQGQEGPKGTLASTYPTHHVYLHSRRRISPSTSLRHSPPLASAARRESRPVRMPPPNSPTSTLPPAASSATCACNASTITCC
jgi:hypothetical protein